MLFSEQAPNRSVCFNYKLQKLSHAPALLGFAEAQHVFRKSSHKWEFNTFANPGAPLAYPNHLPETLPALHQMPEPPTTSINSIDSIQITQMVALLVPVVQTEQQVNISPAPAADVISHLVDSKNCNITLSSTCSTYSAFGGSSLTGVLSLHLASVANSKSEAQKSQHTLQTKSDREFSVTDNPFAAKVSAMGTAPISLSNPTASACVFDHRRVTSSTPTSSDADTHDGGKPPATCCCTADIRCRPSTSGGLPHTSKTCLSGLGTPDENPLMHQVLDACTGFSETTAEASYDEHAVWELFSLAHMAGPLLPGCGNIRCNNLCGRIESEVPTQLCSGCRRVCYCCKECQRVAWSEGHKDVCHSL